jgi:DNA-binding NarL/FixJ family response regulator
MDKRRGKRIKRFARGQPATEIGIDEVTSRQAQVLDGLVKGLTNKEIAERLGVVPGTVKAHIYRLMRRFGVHTRTQLAMLWSTTGGKMLGRGREDGDDTGRRAG